MAMDTTKQPQFPQVIPNQNPGAATPGEWSSGLFACCDDPSNCFVTCFCPCITFGQIAEVIDQGTTSCTSAGLIYGALTIARCARLYSFPYRSKLRNLYSLPEGRCGDCLLHCCCERCALCQEYRELKIRGVDPSIGWAGNVAKWNLGASTTPPPVAPGMSR